MTDLATARTVAKVAAPPNFPEEVWEFSSRMTAIRNFARSEGDSPDALFGLLLARFGAMLGPEWRTPSFTARRTGSLNLNVAIVGYSAAGKSTSNDTARSILPRTIDPKVRMDLSIGTGEGLIDAYFTTKRVKDDDGNTRSVKTQTFDRILFVLDEGEELQKESERPGSKLMPTFRAAWSGGPIGQTNASEERFRNLPAHSYRMNTIINVQPAVASFILKGHNLGTPQRFLFVSAYDLNQDNYEQVDALALEPDELLTEAEGLIHDELNSCIKLSIDPAIMDELAERRRAIRGFETIVDEQESHRDLAQMKIASYVTLIHKRGRITIDDWNLAGVIFDNSQAVVRWLIEIGNYEEEIRRLASDQRHAQKEYAADALRERKTTERLAATLARKVHRDGADGLTMSEAEQAISGRDRAKAEGLDVIDYALDQRWIARSTVNGEILLRPGDVQPPAARGRR